MDSFLSPRRNRVVGCRAAPRQEAVGWVVDAHLPEDRPDGAHRLPPLWAEAEDVIRKVAAGVLALASEVAEQVGNHGHASVDQRRTS